MKHSSLPTVFIAFANDLDDHLATLKQESRNIYDVLSPLEEQGDISIHREESIEVDELYHDLLSFNDRVVIFHYAGHADGTMLQFEQGVGGADGIAGLLGQQTSLKLVFLNGCATKDQVNALHQAGIPAVIATAVKINDSKATLLSHAFYQALADGQSIFEAFDSAKHYIETKFGSANGAMPSISRQPNSFFGAPQQDANQSLEFEWGLYTRADAEDDLKQWRLTAAQQDWQVQLEDSKGKIKDRDGSPILVDYRQRLRNIDVKRCLQCGTNHYPANSDAEICPACGANQLVDKPVQTIIADKQSTFSIEQEAALELAKTALACDTQEQIELQPIFLPFWVFNVDVYVDVTAKKGVLKDPHADNLALEWEAISTTIEQHYVDALVPGFNQANGHKPLSNMPNLSNWQFDLESVYGLSQLDSNTPFVPFDIYLEPAFGSFSGYLEEQISMQIPQAIGGIQQSNIKTQIAYEHFSAKSVMIPHWYAYIKTDTTPEPILINAHNGEIKHPIEAGQSVFSYQSNVIMNKQNNLDSSSSSQTSHLISIFSGAGIGVMVGLLMGLAAPQGDDAKSIVAIFIGAVGVGLAALLGLNDRHFSAAKGLRIGSFGIAVALSSLSGIYVRDNALLSPSLSERAGELRFIFDKIDDPTLIRLLSTSQNTSSNQDNAQTDEQQTIARLMSALFSTDTVDRSTCTNLATANDSEAKLQGILKTFRYYDEDEKLGWKKLADKVEANFPVADQKAMLLTARDTACGDIPDAEPITADSRFCKAFSDGVNNTPSIRSVFEQDENAKVIMQIVEAKISLPNRDKALKYLVPIMCSNKTEENS